jgi:SAM-dependent methyltransferase
MLPVMDRATRLALNAVNSEFYTRVASEWSETRRTPWPGFARVLAQIRARSVADADAAQGEASDMPLRVLDVGAGDGRFAAYLRDAYRGDVDYCGVDASSDLLARAQRRDLGARWRFVQSDFVEAPPYAALPPGPFDLIAVLGVLHHVPGHIARCELVHALAARIAAHGLLAVTFWRLTDDPRFASRVVPWTVHNATAHAPIPLEQLEPGDTLLRWGAGNAPPRYCHFPNTIETEALLAATELSVVDRFRADGRGDRLNEYVLLAPSVT